MTIDQTMFAAARLKAMSLQPFVAVALFALTPVERPGLGTFAVDERWRLHLDPEAMVRWGVDHTAGVLLHEVAHVIRDHAGRARDLGVDESSQLRWNVAADAEINDSLTRDGVSLPEGIRSSRLGLPPDRAAEFYFEALAGRGELPTCACGEGSHGIADSSDVDVSTLEVGVSAIEADLLRRQVAIEVRNHAGRHPGSIGGDWVRWATSVLEPVIPWRRLLRGAVRSAVANQAGRVDYSYARPARRRRSDVVVPSMVAPIPTVAVIIDTSGSMDQPLLDQAWSEVQGCLKAIGVRRDLLRVFAADTVAARIDVGRHGRLPGGGGTDMGAAIRCAVEERPRPDLIVVLTDGFTPWPAAAPPSRVVVGLLASDWGSPMAPPGWAQVIAID